MANEKNLIPNDQRTPSERRENAKKAGQASGAARRRKRAMRRAASMLLNTPVPANTQTKLAAAIKELLGIFGYNEADVTYQDALLAGIMLKAMKGDVRAAEFIRDTAGESPALEIRKAELKLKREQAGGVVSKAENNLLDAIMGAGEVDTDDLPEVE